MVTKSRKTSDRMLKYLLFFLKTLEKKEKIMEEQNTPIWWLNDESEQMLNRGVSLKGETVEGAIDRITTAAAKRLYKPELIPGFSKK